MKDALTWPIHIHAMLEAGLKLVQNVRLTVNKVISKQQNVNKRQSFLDLRLFERMFLQKKSLKLYYKVYMVFAQTKSELQ